MKKDKSLRRSSKGQVVVEYVLLLIVTVSLAAMVVKQIASRDNENPGIIVSKWNEILKAIGEDISDP